jgi:uncharacterized protein
MATKVKEATIEDKLKALYHLQTLHSKLDEIHILKGELPMEVSDLEDEIQGLETRIGKLNETIENLENDIAGHKNAITESEAAIAKYEKQQLNVKNNREFDALTKEIEMQKLEIELLEKKIREATEAVEAKKSYLEESNTVIQNRNEDLELKKNELEKIILETIKEEKQIEEATEKSKEEIEERFLVAYNRIRKAYRNKLAVVKFDRDSCGGCFAKIPPQKQVEIGQRKKIIVCEHCGRILVDPDIDAK